MKEKLLSLLVFFCFIVSSVQGETIAPPLKVVLFDLQDVRILSGPFKKAQDYNRKHLLSLDADRLLYGMRQGAGLTPKASSHYGGWDNWGSTAAGAYLSACSLMYAATGDERLLERANYVVSEMLQCQQAWGDGGLHVNGPEADWFTDLRAGNLRTSHVIPWYQTHKILAGLRDAWWFTQNEAAKQVLIRMGDWAIDVTANLSDRQWQDMLNCEHGGPHEVLADIYEITGNVKYLNIAEKFRHNSVFNAMVQDRISALYGLHGNTQIPKFVGYERIGELNGQSHWRLAAENFYNQVTKRLSWSNGANTQWESFFPPKDFSIKVKDLGGPETCNTYNMLKMTRQMYRKQARLSYVDYYENALYNHILPSLDPVRGGYVYYTSMKPGHYRVFSTDHDSFWCCVLTGFKNPGRYGDMIYAHDDEGIYVNLFIPSEVTWRQKGVTIRQETDIPMSNTATFNFQTASPKKMKLNIRCPEWADLSGMTVRVNGQLQSISASAGQYVQIERFWQTGDQVVVELPAVLQTEFLPGSEDYVSIFYGPVMLAGALGSIDLTARDFMGGGLNDQGAYKKGLWSDVPVLVDDVDQIPSKIIRQSPDSLAFKTVGLARPRQATLLPFYELHRQRYIVYWPVAEEAEYAAMRQSMDAEDQQILKLRQKSVDHVEMGVHPISENQHNVKGINMDVGRLPCMKYRAASDGGWFSYDVAVLPDKAMTLVCRYWGSDGGARAFDILVDGVVVAAESLNSPKPNEFVYIYYPIPSNLTSGKTEVTVKFDANPDNTAGGLFELWVLEP